MKRIFKRKKQTLWAVIAIAVFAFTIGGISTIRGTQSIATSAAKKKLPIYCVDTQGKPQLSISFDAAWGAEDTDTLLDILDNNDVKATFFLCGYWVDKYPEEVKKIYEGGHDIGNHSNTHPHSSQLSLEDNKNNIMECHNKIKNLLNIDPILYRPPFGEYNDIVLTAAEECSYYPIQWNVDTQEIKYKEITTTIL